MNDLDPLAGGTFEMLENQGHEWIASFSGQISIAIACLWRLLEEHSIRVTSKDNQQQFGLPAAINAAEEVNNLIGGATVTAVVLKEGTLDIELKFSSGHVLQIYPDSSGYESWQVTLPGKQLIAAGGGDLVLSSSSPLT